MSYLLTYIALSLAFFVGFLAGSVLSGAKMDGLLEENDRLRQQLREKAGEPMNGSSSHER